jgi:predicted kinase/diadenosine tetraphosphatase ApaH/serine/threonine PP2A family protein phosphatase
MKITIPSTCLVVLIGASGSGKSTFARRHFLPTEIISSDSCRGLVSDDETSLDATGDAFDVLHFIAGKRLARNRLTVVDATSVQQRDRKSLIELARRHHTLAVAIVLDLPERVCHDRNKTRPDRQFGPHVVRRHREALRRSLRGLRSEGFRSVHVLSSPEEVDAVTIEREPLWVDQRALGGPFDLIGDVHGCYDELAALLTRLGYVIEEAADTSHGCRASHPDGRTAVFVGDLVDRGPATPAVLRLVMSMVESGSGLCVAGNHEDKLLRKLKGRNVQITHGLAETLEQLAAGPPEFMEPLQTFLDGLRSHCVLDGGKLVVAHAGLTEPMHGRASAAVRAFALYGDTTGETDEYGLPVRLNWAAEYRGAAMVVYGHTPVLAPEWLNNTIDIDTGCVFGGSLTALRYPEREVVSVPAARVYYEPARPIPPAAEAHAPIQATPAPSAHAGAEAIEAAPQQALDAVAIVTSPLASPAPVRTAQQQQDDLLDIEDVVGRRVVGTRLLGNVTIGEEHATAALEVLSRFAADPRWLVYLPPTMSPTETSRRPGLLEHPDEAFAYFRGEGVSTVICQEKHMGSRMVAVVCRDADTARTRFGDLEGRTGICYTRTGRHFFEDAEIEQAVLDRLRTAIDRIGLWDRLGTSWLLLDCELMPWSAKAQGLLRRQYAAVGIASRTALADAGRVVQQALARSPDADPTLSALATTVGRRQDHARRYVEAYRRYCWPVSSIDDLALAPFQILASDGGVLLDRDHRWQMETLAELARADAELSARPLLRPTPHRLVNLADDEAVTAAAAWWTELTAAGGEGMVVKPLEPIVRGRRGLAQPALKVRGPEYLRIIYGPEYLEPDNLERLRSRGVGRKRGLALRELALGIEGLERFVRREPLRRVHECAAGVLALESEPVDPRL